MFRSEKTLRYRHKKDNPSFSSSLLDQICRSIDDNDGNNTIADPKDEDLKFNRETIQKKQSKGSSMENKVFEHANVEKKHISKEFKRKSRHNVGFFSSSSNSSDSNSSGGFPSSDTESIMYGTKTKASCFVPKPVRTSMSAARTEKPLFTEQSNLPTNKIYGSLTKKVKQPISPGARLASFINSLFTTTGNNSTKKSKSPSSVLRYDDEVSTTCSSATSFSRSCLSKNSPSTRDKMPDGVKRTVRFCPVNVIIDEDSRPCRQGSRLLPVSVPAAWKIGKWPSRKCEEEVKFQVMEKSKRVEEIAREFLKEYHQNQKNSSHYVVTKMDEDDYDDDVASDSSSDLFELDHLVLKGSDKYREELPVYETTHVETNRAIANGLIV